MIQIISIAIGGALGALCRYGMTMGISSLIGRGFPYGTLVVNILGSFLMGAAYVIMIEEINVNPEWRVGITIGLLGAFTTFSTFSIETLNLLESGDAFKAGLNILLSISFCMLGCWLGMIIGRQS
jgi:CrcB protein